MIPIASTTAKPLGQLVTNSNSLHETCDRLGIDFEKLGVIVVDHGSRRSESNAALLDVVSMFRQHTSYPLVGLAHMELAEPSLRHAFAELVKAGAQYIVVHPYFLLPGRHWAQDIPRLAAEAAQQHPGVDYIVTAPLGIHPLMAQIMDDRIRHCLQHSAGEVESCELCEDQGKCRERNKS